MLSIRERTIAMRQFSKISLACAVAAVAITPLQAAELPRVPAPVTQADYATQTVLNDGADEAEQRRRHRRHREDGIDAGDVIAGALIIGGIAAVLSATSKDRRDEPADDYYQPDDRYQTDYEPNGTAYGGPQYSDDTYARARASTNSTSSPSASSSPGYSTQGSGPQPAYPGGPLPGDEPYDDDGYADNYDEGEPY